MLVFVADFSCLLYNVYDVNSGAKWGSWSGRDQRRQGRQRIAGSKGWSGILFQIYLQKRVVFMKMIMNDVTFFSGRSWRTRFTWRQRGERREGGDSEYWLHLFLRLFLFCVWALMVFFFFTSFPRVSGVFLDAVGIQVWMEKRCKLSENQIKPEQYIKRASVIYRSYIMCLLYNSGRYGNTWHTWNAWIKRTHRTQGKVCKTFTYSDFSKKKKFNFSYYFRETKETQEPVELMEILEKKEKKWAKI